VWRQGVVRHARPLQLKFFQVPVDDFPDPAPAEALAAGTITDGGEQRHAAIVGEQVTALFEVALDGVAHIAAQKNQPIVALAAHQ
jgi:hypothetical protein